MKKFASLVIVAALAPPLSGADWPNWLGPLRNGSSPETGLLTTWPAAGPKVLWKVAGGDGYSSVAVAQGKAITVVQHDNAEFVLALDAVKGTKLWETKVADAYKNMYGNGPRARRRLTVVSSTCSCLQAISHASMPPRGTSSGP